MYNSLKTLLMKQIPFTKVEDVCGLFVSTKVKVTKVLRSNEKGKTFT